MLFSPDSRILAVCQHGAILLYDVAGELTQQNNPLHRPAGHVEAMEFDSKGKVLAVAYRDGETGAVVLFDVSTRRRLQSVPLLIPGAATSVRFVQHDTVLALTYHGDDNGIRMWNIDAVSWTKRAKEIANRPFNEEEALRYHLIESS